MPALAVGFQFARFAAERQRQADDQRESVELADLRGERLGVAGELLALERRQRRRDAALDVGQREPDRLGSEIDSDQPPATGSKLTTGDTEAGEIASAAFSPNSSAA